MSTPADHKIGAASTAIVVVGAVVLIALLDVDTFTGVVTLVRPVLSAGAGCAGGALGA